MSLTKMQRGALEAIKKWYKNKSSKQTFVFAGYAGTGKSFLINYIIDELKLNPDDIIFATYTGKASLVVTQKAKGKYICKTLHSTLYNVEVDAKGQVIFTKKDPSEFKGKKLVIVDEASMVPENVKDDLLALGIKVLFVGDHGQLPPIGNENSWLYTRLKYSPDYQLTEIHRQAKGNPIIWLATQVRKGKPIELGSYAKKALVFDKAHLGKVDKLYNSLVKADQVLCGLNATRHQYNTLIRGLKGIHTHDPVEEDKIICLRNNWEKVIGDYALVNGMIGTIHNLKGRDNGVIQFNFKPDFLNDSFAVKALREQVKGAFVDFKLLPDDIKEEIDQFNYGYCITTHKAQGSQWGNVFVINETFKGAPPNEHGYNPEWLYTAITRAENALMVGIAIKTRSYYMAV